MTAARRFVVYPGAERYPVAPGEDATPLPEPAGELHRLAVR